MEVNSPSHIKKQKKPSRNEYVSLDVIFNKYYKALCFFAYKIVQNKPAGEDIVENVFVKLWEKQPDFSLHKNIKAVLYIGVKNACIDYIKARQRYTRKNLNLFYSIGNDNEDFILNEIIRAEVLREIYAEMQNLPPQQRRVMQLLFVEGVDSKQIASQLNISTHTVKKHKLNGILSLRKKFGASSFLLLAIASYL